MLLGWNATAVSDNFGNLWTVRGAVDIVPGLSAVTAFGLLRRDLRVADRLALSADAWNNITFTAGEVKDPRRNIPLSLALGTIIVIGLYLLANVAYLVTLPFEAIQHAPADRVATATLNAIFPGAGAVIMAIAIIISTFGCNNGLILAGARAYYAMARDGLFFRSVAQLNDAKVPAWGLVWQGVWASFLVLPRTYNATTGAYGNLYSNLLDYVISAALIFYILTIAAVFRLRQTRPAAERPYQAFGYPVVPGALHRRRDRDSDRAVRLPDGHDVAGTDHRAARSAGLHCSGVPEASLPPGRATREARARALAGHPRLNRVELFGCHAWPVAEQVVPAGIFPDPAHGGPRIARSFKQFSAGRFDDAS